MDRAPQRTCPHLVVPDIESVSGTTQQDPARTFNPLVVGFESHRAYEVVLSGGP